MYTVLHLQKLGLKNCKTKVFTPRCQRHCVVNFQHKYLRDIGSIFENSLACQPHRNVFLNFQDTYFTVIAPWLEICVIYYAISPHSGNFNYLIAPYRLQYYVADKYLLAITIFKFRHYTVSCI